MITFRARKLFIHASGCFVCFGLALVAGGILGFPTWALMGLSATAGASAMACVLTHANYQDCLRCEAEGERLRLEKLSHLQATATWQF